jgi:hypothetical protein
VSGFAVINWSGSPGVDYFIEHYATTSMMVVVLLFFLSGLFDAVVLKSRNLARVTWVWGLLILAAWTSFPFSLVRIVGAAVVLVVGLGLITMVDRELTRRDAQK